MYSKSFFKTEEERTYFLVTLSVHPEAQVEAQVEKFNIKDIQAKAESLTIIEQEILRLCLSVPLSTREVANRLGYKSISGNLKKAFPNLIQHELLHYTIPDKPRSSKQKYKTTQLGKEVLKRL